MIAFAPFPGVRAVSRLAGAVRGDAVASAVVSAQTAVVAVLVAVVLGTWLALGTAQAPAAVRRVLDGAAHLPLAVPSVVVGLALSMGEVGATNMLYPPDWRTLPVSVFALTDRGQVFAASASTVLLLGITLAGLVALGAVRLRAAER